MADPSQLGMNIRGFRERAEIAQRELERICGAKRGAIAAVENGFQQALPSDVLLAVADYFGVTLDRLMRGEGAAAIDDRVAGLQLRTDRIQRQGIHHSEAIDEIKEVIAAMTDTYKNLKRNDVAQAGAIQELRDYVTDTITNRLEACEQRLEKVEKSQQLLLANQQALGTDDQRLEKNLSALSSNVAIMCADMHKRFCALEGNSDVSSDDLDQIRERGARMAERVDESLEEQTARQFNFFDI